MKSENEIMTVETVSAGRGKRLFMYSHNSAELCS